MHERLITCPPECALAEVAALLVRHRVHALVVTDGAGKPRGVVSDTDLLSGEWLASDAESLETMRSMTAGELLTEPIALVPADTALRDAAARMRAEHIARLVVVDGDDPCGIIAVSDLVGSLAQMPARPRSVAEVMARGVVVARPDTPISGLARAMRERHSRSIIIVNDRGAAVGVVTGFDLLGLIENDKPYATAADLMRPPLTIGPEASLQEAADAMLQHEVHRLVVLESAEAFPLGIVSTFDIIAEMAEPDSVWATH
jgi:CBS domain-containing protein